MRKARSTAENAVSSHMRWDAPELPVCLPLSAAPFPPACSPQNCCPRHAHAPQSSCSPAGYRRQWSAPPWLPAKAVRTSWSLPLVRSRRRIPAVCRAGRHSPAAAHGVHSFASGTAVPVFPAPDRSPAFPHDKPLAALPEKPVLRRQTKPLLPHRPVRNWCFLPLSFPAFLELFRRFHTA